MTRGANPGSRERSHSAVSSPDGFDPGRIASADDAAAEAARLGELYREVQARNYGCSGDIECAFLLGGNCYCFNRALELHVADRVEEVLYPTPTAIAFALPLTDEPDDDDWRLGDEACEILACVNTDGETAAAQLARDYRNVAQFLRASAIEARKSQGDPS